jgi:hypothetical protein
MVASTTCSEMKADACLSTMVRPKGRLLLRVSDGLGVDGKAGEKSLVMLMTVTPRVVTSLKASSWCCHAFLPRALWGTLYPVIGSGGAGAAMLFPYWKRHDCVIPFLEALSRWFGKSSVC